MSEYVCIFLAPAFLIFFQRSGFHMNSVYDLHLGGFFDFKVLLYTTTINFFVEILVDWICWRFENDITNMEECWQDIAAGEKYTKRLLPFMVCVLSTTCLCLIFALYRVPNPDFDCTFVRQCLPNPCLCNTTSDGYIILSNSSMSQTSRLPQYIGYACDMIASNQTQKLKQESYFFNI
jgi:hypothetical protein